MESSRQTLSAQPMSMVTLLDINDITVSGSVDTEKPGIYKVTYEIIKQDTGIILKSTAATIMVRA